MTDPQTSDLHVVVLAAGKGTRMKTRRPKLLHPLAGQPVLGHVLRRARGLSAGRVLLVIGFQADELQQAFAGAPGLVFVRQEPQAGTGHAVLQVEPQLSAATGDLLVLPADVPMISLASLRRAIAHHRASGAAATLLTAQMPRPYGYGRVLRKDGAIARIVEEADATPEQRKITEINSGAWVLALDGLFDALRDLAPNDRSEYYLTDLVHAYRKAGRIVESVLVGDATEVCGINSQNELAEVAAIVRRARNEELLGAGVTLIDPDSAYIDDDVEVGADTIIHPNVYLEGQTRIGQRCQIHSGVRMVDCEIGDDVEVRNYCVLEDARVAAGARIGPFAHLRPGSDVGEQAHVGNFVELKKTVLGPGSKANHLAYLGDATVGAGVNIGAGTITCNYDGERKYQTTIEDGVFIGSDSQLVAPVTIGKGAYVGAGSSITQDVPPGSLAIARGRQVIKEGWVETRRKK